MQGASWKVLKIIESFFEGIAVTECFTSSFGQPQRGCRILEYFGAAGAQEEAHVGRGMQGLG